MNRMYRRLSLSCLGLLAATLVPSLAAGQEVHRPDFDLHIRALSEPAARPRAIATLVLHGKSSVPSLVAHLCSAAGPDRDDRECEIGGWAARTLGFIGPDAAEVVPRILDSMRVVGPEEFIRCQIALGDLAPFATTGMIYL